jgi:hypothetical protein
VNLIVGGNVLIMVLISGRLVAEHLLGAATLRIR